MNNWKFKDLPNTAAITNNKIINKLSWIGYVSHDINDGSWQFLENNNEKPDIEAAVVVSLQNIAELDPSIIELANLPLGWFAWRDSNQAKWQRAKK